MEYLQGGVRMKLTLDEGGYKIYGDEWGMVFIFISVFITQLTLLRDSCDCFFLYFLSQCIFHCFKCSFVCFSVNVSYYCHCCCVLSTDSNHNVI